MESGNIIFLSGSQGASYIDATCQKLQSATSDFPPKTRHGMQVT